MNPDTASIIGTVITVGVALAGVMYALVNGTHRRIDDVRSENRETHAGITKNIDDVKQDIRDVKQDVRMLTSHMLNRAPPPDTRVRQPELSRRPVFTRLRPETLNAEGRVAQAINRVQNLTLGTRRPRFIPTEGGSEAW